MRDLKQSAIPQFEYFSKSEALLKELLRRYPEVMPALFQSIFVSIIGLFLAIFSVFGLNTNEAAAPTESIPAILQEVATTTPENSVEIVEPEPSAPEPVAETPTAETVPAVETTTPEPQAVTQIVQQPRVTPTESFSELNERVRKSVVNLFCTSVFSGPFDAISASGVIIDSRGIVLTNAHVAQYFLLRDYPTRNTMNCVIRTGAPAVPTYTAELMFLPKSWMDANAEKINQDKPMGTGQHDYALVRITGVVNPQNNTLPESFPALPLATDIPRLNEDMLVVGYPAGFLDGISIQRNLYQTSAFTTVRELLTFVESTLDLFSIGGSVVAQSGASGGAVTNMNGELMGIVVTSTLAPDTSSRDLRAITMQYFLRDFEAEARETLGSYATGDLSQKVASFQAGDEVYLINRLTGALSQN